MQVLAVLALVRGDLASGPVLYDGEAQVGLLAGLDAQGLQVERVAVPGDLEACQRFCFVTVGRLLFVPGGRVALGATVRAALLMNTGLRITVFAAALAATFGTAYGVGGAVGPMSPEPKDNTHIPPGGTKQVSSAFLPADTGGGYTWSRHRYPLGV